MEYPGIRSCYAYLQTTREDRRKSDKDQRRKEKLKDGDAKKERRSHDDDDKKVRRSGHRDREEGHQGGDERRHVKERGEEKEHRKRTSEEKSSKRRSKHEGEDEEARQKRHEERRRERKERETSHVPKTESAHEESDQRHRRHRSDKHEPDDKVKTRRHHDDLDDKTKTGRHHEERSKTRRHHYDDITKTEKSHDEDDTERRRHHKQKDEDGHSRKHKDGEDRRRREDDGQKDVERRHRRRREDGDEETRRHHKDKDGADVKERKQHREDKPKDSPDEKTRRHHSKEERHIEKKTEKRDHVEKEETKKHDKSKSSSAAAESKKDSDDGEDDYNYDDEEFEDYDDDFEDDEDEGSEEEAEKKNQSRHPIDTIYEALNEENDQLMRDAKAMQNSTQSKQSPRDQISDTKHMFINFASSQKRVAQNRHSNRARNHANQLRGIVELDAATYHLFELPPIGEYERYMCTFGASNSKQAYVQTNDENIERDIQTEDIERRDMWCQHPQEDLIGCGGDDSVTKQAADFDSKPLDLLHLNKFLQKAGQVIAILLDEELGQSSLGSADRKQQSSIVISETFSQLKSPDFLNGRHVTFSHFSPDHTQSLLTIYSSSQKVSDDKLSDKGAICVWNVSEPSQPQQILACESQPQCCCFSPNTAKLVFAGMQDGSLVVWDLREPFHNHQLHHHGNNQWLIRHPTYNTAGIMQSDNHASAVVAIQPIVTQTDSNVAKDGIYQLASLEEMAVINLWVVAEMNHADNAGSESDLGLSPGGRVKLIKSSVLQLENPHRDIRYRTAMQAYDLRLLPSNNSHLYIATNTSCILHAVRYGGTAPPKAYRPESEDYVSVLSLDFSPFSPTVFLAGCKGGSLRLYHIDAEYPLITWPVVTQQGSDIVSVKWCRSRPSVFFVLDGTSSLSIWDLQLSDKVALQSEQISNTQVTSIDLSNDHAATGQGVPGRRPQMVIGLKNGVTEVHTISGEFSAFLPEELTQFERFLKDVV